MSTSENILSYLFILYINYSGDNMDKLIIGIPRGIFYYYDGVFWNNFFYKLNIKTILSPKTNKEIVDLGLKSSPDEMCLSMKIYLGHIKYLEDKVDYILVPRIDRFDDFNQTCTNFLGIYQYVLHFSKKKILNYNIDKDNDLKEATKIIAEELKLDKNKVRSAYKYAYKKQKEYFDNKIKEQENLMKSSKKKVLIISHAYNIHDEYLGRGILDIFKENNISILYSNYFNSKKTNALALKISPNLYWKYSRDAIGSLELAKNIDGVVFFSTFPCGLDSLVNELVIRKIHKPCLNLIIDDSTSLTGLETRIESFVDLLEN